MGFYPAAGRRRVDFLLEKKYVLFHCQKKRSRHVPGKFKVRSVIFPSAGIAIRLYSRTVCRRSYFSLVLRASHSSRQKSRPVLKAPASGRRYLSRCGVPCHVARIDITAIIICLRSSGEWLVRGELKISWITCESIIIAEEVWIITRTPEYPSSAMFTAIAHHPIIIHIRQS